MEHSVNKRRADMRNQKQIQQRTHPAERIRQTVLLCRNYLESNSAAESDSVKLTGGLLDLYQQGMQPYQIASYVPLSVKEITDRVNSGNVPDGCYVRNRNRLDESRSDKQPRRVDELTVEGSDGEDIPFERVWTQTLAVLCGDVKAVDKPSGFSVRRALRTAWKEYRYGIPEFTPAKVEGWAVSGSPDGNKLRLVTCEPQVTDTGRIWRARVYGLRLVPVFDVRPSQRLVNMVPVREDSPFEMAWRRQSGVWPMVFDGDLPSGFLLRRRS